MLGCAICTKANSQCTDQLKRIFSYLQFLDTGVPTDYLDNYPRNPHVYQEKKKKRKGPEGSVSSALPKPPALIPKMRLCERKPKSVSLVILGDSGSGFVEGL